MRMADSIVLKTYKGGNVTPQDDAIIYQTVISANGIFKGCEITYARGNVLHISQGFGMIKGRFFEVYESEVVVPLNSGSGKLNGRLYIHLDLGNTDEPIQILSETGETLSTLADDHDINYNNTAFDIELATFRVSGTDLTDLEQTFSKITGASAGGSGSGGAVSSLLREETYNKGDFAVCGSTPGWVTLYCTQSGETARMEPSGYRNIMKRGDTVLDGTCIFEARDVIGEIDGLGDADESIKQSITSLNTRIEELKNDTADMVMKVLSYDDYRQLEERSDRIIYLCYEDGEARKITKIFVGGTKVYYTDVQVTYRIDDGEETVKYLQAGDDALVSAPEAEKEGCTFLGWRMDKAADSEVLTGYIVERDTPATLYAVFDCPDEITVDFYGNGGEGEDPAAVSATAYFYNNGSIRSHEKAKFPANPYNRVGYLFAGWGHGSEPLYKPGKQAYLEGDTTIVPIWLAPTVEFAYTGGSTQYKVPADGIYKLEVWGAKGGAQYSGNASYVGQGGHSKGYAKLKKGEMIYLAVGGAGYGSSGGFNGGGRATGSGGSYSSYYGGGGCTHMAKLPGTLKDIGVKNADKILIVAGGGGGGQKYGSSADSCAKGGDGGGLSGVAGNGAGAAGQQTPSFEDTAIQFGYGGDGYYAGGGGGWYGGNGGESGAGSYATGGGGSGYIGGVASFSYNRVFYEAETEAGVNMGNGKASITFITLIN